MSNLASIKNNLVTIVSHDPGGAEILSDWVACQSSPYLLVLDGPARKIFERKLGKIDAIPLEQAIAQTDWVLTGTSWQSDIEIQAIKVAKKLNKRSISFLDRWVNYPQRFMLDGKFILPDEIWVGDKDAFSLAKKEFPETDIRLQSNPYFDNLKSQINQLNAHSSPKPTEKYILYACSPLSELAKLKFHDDLYWGFSDHDAVRFFLKNIAILKHSTNKVILRPHPSEKKGKYDWAVAEYAPNVSIGGHKSLLEEIISADIVSGCNSMAMVIGLIAEKRVVNALPPGTLTNALPMNNIEQMSTLLENHTL